MLNNAKIRLNLAAAFVAITLTAFWLGCAASPAASPTPIQPQNAGEVVNTPTLPPIAAATAASTPLPASTPIPPTPIPPTPKFKPTPPTAVPSPTPTRAPTASPVSSPTPTPLPTGPYITIGDATFVAEIADTQELRTKGLGMRDSLNEQSGMLFLFPDGRASSFWMRGMRFPLDFVWIGADCTVVDLTENVQHAPPDTPSSELEIFTSESPAAYTFEINAGEVAHFGIERGAPVSFHNMKSEYAMCCESGACDGN